MVIRATFLNFKAILGRGTTWANDMNFVMNHVQGAGLINQPVDLQPNTLPLCYGAPHPPKKEEEKKGLLDETYSRCKLDYSAY